MCNALEIDDLGLTKWDRRLIGPIVEFHSVLSLPKPDGWSRAKTGSRYVLTPSGYVSAEDMSGKLMPKEGTRHLLVVGRDEKYVGDKKRREASLITYKMMRLLEVDWLWCLPPGLLTAQYKPIPKDRVRVVYVPGKDEFEFRGAGKLFFSMWPDKRRCVVREITDERAYQYFERRCRVLDNGRGVAKDAEVGRGEPKT